MYRGVKWLVSISRLAWYAKQACLREILSSQSGKMSDLNMVSCPARPVIVWYPIVVTTHGLDGHNTSVYLLTTVHELL